MNTTRRTKSFSARTFGRGTLEVSTISHTSGAPAMPARLPAGPDRKMSFSLKLVERLTRVAHDTIEYELEVEDPEMLTGPWKAAFP